MLVEFLSERGLELSEEKTLITHIDDGFDFLGFNIRKFKGVLLTQPSKKSVKKFLDSIRYVQKDDILKKGKRWITNKYFHFYKTRRWTFLVKSIKNGKVDIFPLKFMFDTKIIRHKKIKSEANPFDMEWKSHFEERMTYKMLLSLKGRKSLLYIWNKQEHKCPLCNEKITADTQWNVREQKENGQIVRYLVHDKCYKQNR